jgi:hypothetical protein
MTFIYDVCRYRGICLKCQRSPSIFSPPLHKLISISGKMFLTDPKLAVKLIFGPPVAYQFRLNGRHQWDGAKKAIETVWNRVEAPL